MSLPLSDTVDIQITQDSVGVQRAGFGVPMLLSGTASFPDRIRYYTSLAEVIADFPVTTGAEYLFGQTSFSAANPPSQIAIGRSALPATQVYVIAVSALRNSDSISYKVNVAGAGITTTTAAPAATDSSATNDEIAALIVTALNGVAGKNYTAVATGSSSAHVVTVTATAAGDWFSLEVLDPTALSVSQTHIDPGVATDLAAIALVSSDWYALYTVYNSDAYVKAAAAWTETQLKIYMADSNETVAITVASDGTQGTLDDLATLAYKRTATMWHPSPAYMAGASWLAGVLPLEPGSETWKFKALAGVPTVTLTSTQRNNLRARHANSYEASSGVGMTWNGTTVDGGYIDTARNKDWMRDDMSKSVFEVLLGLPKVPFTDLGISLIVGAMRGSLTRAAKRTMIDDDFVITFPKAKDVSTINKANRLLPDLEFNGTLQGAVHGADITGVVSL